MDGYNGYVDDSELATDAYVYAGVSLEWHIT
jgi:hypothetical protein